jgi:hypothetical protein
LVIYALHRACSPRSADAMRDGVSAFVAVLGHAQQAGIAHNLTEMRQFAENLFRIARTAATLDCIERQRIHLILILLLRYASTHAGITGCFDIATSVLGGRMASRIAGVAKK